MLCCTECGPLSLLRSNVCLPTLISAHLNWAAAKGKRKASKVADATVSPCNFIVKVRANLWVCRCEVKRGAKIVMERV